jgi:hypothetical protein
LASCSPGIPVKHTGTGIVCIKAGVGLSPPFGSPGIRGRSLLSRCRQGRAKNLIKTGQPIKSLGLAGTEPGIFKLVSTGIGNQGNQC